ncbi:helix-turn-helix domain-containing protein [Streptomyces sp. NPDC059477]|uniref:helix-turn-helix domain-containing protein n=1 Tax=Streptomyces sp. NPDC059477 TaxID=3346847 RepID=UPI0036B13D5A
MTNESADDPGWDVPPGEEFMPLIEAVARMLKSCRTHAGLSVVAFAEAMGYGEDMIRKLERGDRIPRPEFLDRADSLMRADGRLRWFMEDVEKARYPKRVRELKAVEDRTVEALIYSNHNIHGLLQTAEHAKALFEMVQPPYSASEVEQGVAWRMARKAIFEREPTPTLSFVQEQVSLERPIGGRAIQRRQLEHLLELSQLRHVALQIMPTDREEHAGVNGRIQVMKFADGTAVGRSDGEFFGRPFDNPRELRILELRYGMIRAQALSPRESQAFIERRLGEL